MRSKPAVAALRNQGFTIQTVDIRTDRHIVEKYGVRSAPTYVYVLNGKEVRRASGLVSEDSIRWLFLPPLF